MIKIALISDIHFGKDGRGDFTIPDTKSDALPIGELNTERTMGTDLISVLQEQRPEYLFIAGDLTSIGSPAEYFYCEQKILTIVEQTKIEKNKIIWCVGNHDNDWSISKLSDEYSENEKSKKYSEEVEKVSISRYSQIAASVVEKNIEKLPFPKDHGGVPASGVYKDDKIIVFILNSSTTCMHNSEFDHGELTEKQLKWFEKELDECRNDSRWKIVLLHHHPFNYSYPEIGVDISQLSDGSQFQDIAGKGGVNLVLHGHRHHPRCKTQIETGWKNPISYICAGSLSVCEKQRLEGSIPNMFHILELDEENIGQLFLNSYEYLPGSGWAIASKRGGTVPIDPIMRLGKIVSTEAMISEIEKIANTSDQVLSYEWNELPEDLQFIPCENINEQIKITLGDRFVVKAKLPDNLTLKRREKAE